MRSITISELAEKWSVSPRTAVAYLEEGSVEGAVFEGGEWRIPANAPTPERERYKAFMPIWQPYANGESAQMIDALENEQMRRIAQAGQYYFQARYEEACVEAEKCMQSLNPEIRASALLLHCMANVPLGNTAATREDMRILTEEAKSGQDGHMDVIYAYILFLTRVFFHQDEGFEMCFPERFSVLPKGLRLYGLYAYAHALYLSQDYHRALGVAESALAMAEDRYPSVCIYLYLAAAMAAINCSLFAQADAFFQNAWKLAEKENYIQPFVEHHGLLQGQVEKYFRDRRPETYRRITECVLLFSRGWMKIHNPDSINKVTDQLTPFEFALAMMAAKGKSNREIAEYQHISVNTVKFYLSSVYQKLGVTGRGELQQYLNR